MVTLCWVDIDGQRRIGRLLGHQIACLPLDPGDFAGLSQLEHLEPELRVNAAGAVFLPPLVRTARIFCVGRNYAEHAAEMGKDLPQHPNLFLRGHASFVGHGAKLAAPGVDTAYDFEGELAVVIGRAGAHIDASDALSHVFGYTLLMDGSMRGFQNHSLLAGKNFDRSGACGPWIVTADAVSDPQQLHIETRLNGQVMQSAPTSDMIFSVANLIAYISSITCLQPGDIIGTGTPDGVGAGRTPPVWLTSGDHVRVSIPEVGTLDNVVA